MENTFRITSGAISDRGLSEKRPQNEDSYLEMARCGVYAVCDGVGGAQAGDVASQMAVEILSEAFANRRDGDDAESVMRAAISQANSAIHQMAQELPQLLNMATTIVTLHLDGNIATIGHVGDSRLYRLDRDGELFAETADHSMVGEEVRAGRMTQEQADNHPSRNIISRALGAESAVEIDLKTIMIEPGTAFLLCSDGITRHVSDPEIKGVLTFGGEPAEICDYLKNLCYERGAEDNLTAVVVKVATRHATETTDFTNSDTIDIDAGTIDIEEPTIATARTTFEEPVQDDDDDQILELETMKLEMPGAKTLEMDEDAITDPSLPVSEIKEQTVIETVEEPVVDKSEPAIPKEEPFSMFGDSGSIVADEQERSGSFSKVLTALAMLVLGSLIGLGVYHFTLVPPKPVETPDQKLSVMKTDDIAFSSFEKLRRTVDSDPAAFIKQVPTADDAEGYYLIGRANLLIGDFPKARLALIEAQKLLAKAEPTNAKVLNADIASALAITNDPTLQNRFKQELEASSKPASNFANSNANR